MLKPEVSIGTALGVSALVVGLHRGATAPIVDLRSTQPGSAEHADVNKARRQATWASIAVVSAISLLTKDIRVFIVGGAVAVGYDWWERMANEVQPSTGTVMLNQQSATVLAKSGRSGTVVEMSPYGPPQQAVM